MHSHSISLLTAWMALGLATITHAAEPNQLTESERTQGWRLLFDGRTTQGWRGFGKPGFPEKGWVVQDGWLYKVNGTRGGDIITTDQFGNFELDWEWKIAPGGNNGVKYFIVESRGSAVGHEYQMMDDGEKTDKHSTGSFYDVLPLTGVKRMKPVGEVNRSRIVVKGNQVEHYLNGELVLRYECGSAAVTEGVAQSKFKGVAGFGTKVRGPVLLTDHNDACWFRNVKVRELAAP